MGYIPLRRLWINTQCISMKYQRTDLFMFDISTVYIGKLHSCWESKIYNCIEI